MIFTTVNDRSKAQQSRCATNTAGEAN